VPLPKSAGTGILSRDQKQRGAQIQSQLQSRSVPARFKWSLVSDERLLDTRICDLPIRIKGSFIEPHIKRLYSELNVRGIRFKPHVWLSAEWFTPDGVPGFAIPFLSGPSAADEARTQIHARG
jgi:hypothetical protein